MSNDPGEVVGSRCNRNGCEGILELPPVDNCSCHISPPCSDCVENRITCPQCGWEDES